jgi:formate dehydrogenase major subunit
MTQHWIDLKNSDVVMCIGANAAENHPISFKWVQKALDNGGKLIVVDPRYTRSAAKASIVDGIQLWCRVRSGTDIAFLNGMMKWAIDHNRINSRYVQDCTNAKFLLDANFRTCRQANSVPPGLGGGTATGIFSGLVDDPRRQKKAKYNTATWAYQYAAPNQPAVDATLTFPPTDTNSVWLRFVEHLSAYDVNTVCSITGADPVVLEKVYDVYTSTYEDHLSANIMYAMGATQHSYGTQNVRAYSMIQLLLGNVGVAGGGINAMRGESNVQGSTDQALLWHILPGYLDMTNNSLSKKDRTAYKAGYSTGRAAQDITPGGGLGNPISLSWWQNGVRYIDSLLQAWWPLENPRDPQLNLDKAYQYLPKTRDGFWYTHE